MYQAITTKFHGPTNSRGSRVKATAAGGAITLSWDHALNSEQNHMEAAKALVVKLGWVPSEGRGFRGTWVGGGLPSQDGNVFVFTGEGDSPSGWPAGSAFTVGD